MAAAGVQGGESVQTMLDANVTYTVNLVQAAAAVGCRNFIHTGSCFEYAANEGPLTEDSPIKPFSVYGGTKAASVALAQGLANEKEIRLIALRLFGVYGPGEAPGRLIPTVIHALSTREKAPMTHGRQIRDLSYIDDVVEAYVAVLRSFADDEDRSGLYNVCSGTPISVREIGERLVEIMQADPRLLMWGAKPSRGSEPLSIVGSDDKFRRCFGDYSRYDFSTGARRTVDIVNSFRSAA
jgi:nucleoside-diphosphate-sugar epimerase